MEKKNIKYVYAPSNKLFEITRKDGTVGPKDGCLSPYSEKSVSEDVATFVESLSYIKDKKMGKRNYLSRIV